MVNTKTDKNMEWFIKADLSKYEDEYVAIANEKVVSHGEDPEIVYKEANDKYPDKEVVLWKVPKGDVFIFSVFVHQRRVLADKRERE